MGRYGFDAEAQIGQKSRLAMPPYAPLFSIATHGGGGGCSGDGVRPVVRRPIERQHISVLH
jgi:hypothetical protein